MVAQKTNLCFDLITNSVIIRSECYILKLFLKKKILIYFLNVFLSQQNSKKKKTFGVEPWSAPRENQSFRFSTKEVSLFF